MIYVLSLASLKAEDKIRAIIKGKQIVAIITAKTGSELKLKNGVSEKGNKAICIKFSHLKPG